MLVIRLKPGETREVELAADMDTPPKPFRTGSLRRLDVELLGRKLTLVPEELKDKEPTGRYVVSADLVVVANGDRPAFEFHAGKDAKPGATTVRLRYMNTRLGGECVNTFRVIFEKANPKDEK